MNIDSVIVELIRAWGAEKIKKENILNQNGANLVYLHGQDMANKLSIPQDLGHIMPYPPKVEISTQSQDQPKSSLLKKALPWVLAGAAAYGGWALKPEPNPSPPIDDTGEVGFHVK